MNTYSLPFLQEPKENRGEKTYKRTHKTNIKKSQHHK
jgi:hypothetical protein